MSIYSKFICFSYLWEQTCAWQRWGLTPVPSVTSQKVPSLQQVPALLPELVRLTKININNYFWLKVNGGNKCEDQPSQALVSYPQWWEQASPPKLFSADFPTPSWAPAWTGGCLWPGPPPQSYNVRSLSVGAGELQDGKSHWNWWFWFVQAEVKILPMWNWRIY